MPPSIAERGSPALRPAIGEGVGEERWIYAGTTIQFV